MHKLNLPVIRAGMLFIFAALLVPNLSWAEEFKKKVEKPVDQSITIRQDSQKEVEKWAEEKSALEAEFETLTETKERLSSDVERLSADASAREKRVEALNDQIRSMEKISENLTPFLESVHERLAELIRQPPPFLIEERTARLENLRETLDDTAVPMGEKFRKVMEALFIEAEYGNTVETYQHKIEIGGEEVLATVFRLGNMALFFETLDQESVGYFDLAENNWVSLPPESNREIRAAVEIASKVRPAEIVSLPLGRIVVK